MRIPMALVLGLLLIPALGLAGIGPVQAQSPDASPVPIWGVVLGTVIAVGLLYLIVHGPDGQYYRYPYYGEYYGHYYRPDYRPYRGFWPSSSVVVTVAPHVAGVVLGVVLVDGHHYILSRDAGGHLYRYPYFGPYQKVYYKPDYRDYHGAYVSSGDYRRAALRMGDSHWDSDKRILAPDVQRPHLAPRPSTQPNHQPQYNRNQQQTPRGTDQTNHQQYNRNQQQPPRQPNSNQNGGRDNSGGRKPQHQCGHPGEPACPDNGQHP
ncbi:MAG TPA: hypothetical protein VKW09_09030 [bacterium]|nr:hypothetical protein [bacterium]